MCTIVKEALKKKEIEMICQGGMGSDKKRKEGRTGTYGRNRLLPCLPFLPFWPFLPFYLFCHKCAFLPTWMMLVEETVWAGNPKAIPPLRQLTR